MTTFYGFPQNDHSYSADEVGRALAGLIQRESNGIPRVGMISTGPVVTAVPSSWNVLVGIFTYIHQEAGAVQLSGLSAAEQVSIESSATIPPGEARIDLIAWDVEVPELVVVPGTPSASPAAPSAGGYAPVASVRVNAGDGAVITGQITNMFDVTDLVGEPKPYYEQIAKRSVPLNGITDVFVTFPVGMFDTPPNVQVTTWASTRSAQTLVVDVTAAGCKVALINTSAQTQSIGAFVQASGV